MSGTGQNCHYQERCSAVFYRLMSSYSLSESAMPQRLASLVNTLGISQANLEGIRYQLLHRTAAPLLEARRFNASMAIMIVQSFDGDGDGESFNDFSRFCTLMEIDSVRNAVVQSKRKTEVPLLIGWVDCDPATDSQVAEASV